MKKKITLTKDSTQFRQIRVYSKIFNTIWSMVLLLAVFTAGCKKDNYKGAIQGLCPVVVSTDPMDKAVDVIYNKVISATFNTVMRPSTINNSTFIITQGATNVPGTVAPTANGAVFTFTPTVPLLPFKTYTGTITNSVRDTLGTAMVNNYVWTFTTIPLLTVSANPAADGTAVGGGTFAQGSTVTVTATAGTGFTFVNWTNQGVIASASPSYQFTMAGNRALVANFKVTPPTKYSVVLSSNPAAGGTTLGGGTFNKGTSVTVTATPSSTYTFTNWTKNGTIVSTLSSYPFTLNANTTLVANFTPIPKLELSLSSNPAAGGTTTGAGFFNKGTSVTVTATPSSTYTFTNWTKNGTIVSTSSSYTFTLNAGTALVANFTAIKYTLSLSSNPAAGGTTTGGGSFIKGTSVTVKATPSSTYTFTNWTKNGTIVSTLSSYTFTLNATTALVANFKLKVVQPLFTSIFGVFGGSAGITNQGLNTVINGAMGTIAVATKITGFHDGITGDKYTETPLNVGLVTGGIYAAPPFPGTIAKEAIALAGWNAATAFYAKISPAGTPGGTDPSGAGGELGGLTLKPGVYKATNQQTFMIESGNLTLDAQGDPNAVWIFQIPTALTVGVAGPNGAKSVIFKNGVGSPANVYWYVGTAATINGAGGGTMVGTIISTAGVTFSTAGVAKQTILNGRALSLVASVTMVNTTINVPN